MQNNLLSIRLFCRIFSFLNSLFFLTSMYVNTIDRFIHLWYFIYIRFKWKWHTFIWYLFVRDSMTQTIRHSTRLKNKIENNWTWESAFQVYELKLTQVESLQFFHFICVGANAYELFLMTHFANIERFLYHSNLSF